MASVSTKRRRGEDEVRRPKKKIRVKKQKEYHSSSEEDEEDVPIVNEQPLKSKSAARSILKASDPVLEQNEGENEDSDSAFEGLDETARNTAWNTALNTTVDGTDDDVSEDGDEADNADDPIMVNGAPQSDDEDSADGSSASNSEDDETSVTSNQPPKTKSRRHDPTAFATSISKILDTKLTTTKRQDPVLSRSATASSTAKQLADSKLEATARAQLRAERVKSLQKGRITDVLGLEDPSTDTGRVQEEEKRLKKTAQRGVVKLFNAVRAAQVRGEEAGRRAREEGVVGMRQREERVQEMSKEGFLELISRGGGVGVKSAAGA